MSENIKIACPFCSKRLKVPSKTIGKTAKCPGCDAGFKIEAKTQPQRSIDRHSHVTKSLKPTSEPASSKPNQSFSEKLAQHQSAAPQPALNRKEKLQRAKQYRSNGPAEFDWETGSWGLALVILAFASVAMPEAESMRGGRGVVKLLGKAMFVLGPYAPLLGMLLGLGGVALIVGAAKKFPKAWVIAIGSIVSLMIVSVCGTGFLSANGFLKPGSNRRLSADIEPQLSEAAMARQERSIEDFEKRGDEFRAKVLGERKRLMKTFDDSSNQTKPSSTSKNSGSSNPSKSTGTEKHNALGGKRDVAASNPAVQPPNESSLINSHRSNDIENRIANNRTRMEFAKRFARAESLSRFQRNGFSNVTTRLEVGKFVGEENHNGKVFYSNNPINGLLFFQDAVTYVLPGSTDNNIGVSNRTNPDKVFSGVNLNFENGKLAGLQEIFTDPNSDQENDSHLIALPWQGRPPTNKMVESLTSESKRIHGFLVCRKGFDIIGFQLIYAK